MRHKYCIVCYDVILAAEQVLCLNCYERFQESNMSYVTWLITRETTAKEMLVNIERGRTLRLYFPKTK